MNKVYDFDWLVQEIDNSIILKLVNEDKTIGVYQVSDILAGDFDKIMVRFANANDLIKFINHSIVRFRDIDSKENIIDIPLRKLNLLFLNSNFILDGDKNHVSVSDLEAFCVRDEKILKKDCQIYTYKVNDESEELKNIMDIAFKFGNLGMQETFDALAKINLINYHRMKETNVKGT